MISFKPVRPSGKKPVKPNNGNVPRLSNSPGAPAAGEELGFVGKTRGHPERSEGSRSISRRFFATLRMTPHIQRAFPTGFSDKT
jgi:hypothetical protein